jgi:hypothetical protein
MLKLPVGPTPNREPAPISAAGTARASPVAGPLAVAPAPALIVDLGEDIMPIIVIALALYAALGYGVFALDWDEATFCGALVVAVIGLGVGRLVTR